MTVIALYPETAPSVLLVGILFYPLAVDRGDVDYSAVKNEGARVFLAPVAGM